MSEETLTTIRLDGALGKRFGRVHKFYVSSPAEAVRALCSQIEGFKAYLGDENRKTLYKVMVGEGQIDPLEQMHELNGSKEIRISPIIAGAKSGLLQVVLGIVLIVVSFIPGLNAVAWAGASSMFFTLGVSLALGGLAQMLSPQPKLDVHEAPDNTPNTSIGTVNTASQGRPVPLVYGECMAGSVVISAGVYASDTAGIPEQKSGKPGVYGGTK